MNDSDGWLKDELLHAFYDVIEDFNTGTIDEETFKERLLRLAKRYERRFINKELRETKKICSDSLDFFSLPEILRPMAFLN